MIYNNKKWSCGELNPRPLECKSSALPTELQPQFIILRFVCHLSTKCALITPFIIYCYQIKLIVKGKCIGTGTTTAFPPTPPPSPTNSSPTNRAPKTTPIPAISPFQGMEKITIK